MFLLSLWKKNREVITLHRNMDVPKLIEDLTSTLSFIFEKKISSISKLSKKYL